MGFRVRRHHVPRCCVGVGFGQQFGVGVLVIGPELAFFKVLRIEFPVLLRVVQPRLQARLLFVLRDMQEELDDDGAGLGQHPLEVADMRKPPLALLPVYPAMHPRYQHIFVLAAVEDDDLALPRHRHVDAPQEVMFFFHGGGRLEGDGAQPQRVGGVEHAAYGAVLARAVQALQDDQQLALVFGIENILKRGDLTGQYLDCPLVHRLVAGGQRFDACVLVPDLEFF